jgi:hypothetical protein
MVSKFMKKGNTVAMDNQSLLMRLKLMELTRRELQQAMEPNREESAVGITYSEEQLITQVLGMEEPILRTKVME